MFNPNIGHQTNCSVLHRAATLTASHKLLQVKSRVNDFYKVVQIVVRERNIQDKYKRKDCSPFAGDGRISRHRFGGHFEI